MRLGGVLCERMFCVRARHGDLGCVCVCVGVLRCDANDTLRGDFSLARTGTRLFRQRVSGGGGAGGQGCCVRP
jgi:hypothetical protein